MQKMTKSKLTRNAVELKELEAKLEKLEAKKRVIQALDQDDYTAAFFQLNKASQWYGVEHMAHNLSHRYEWEE